MSLKKVCLLAASAFALSMSLAFANTTSLVQECGDNGKIDWFKGKVYVVGRAAPKAGTTGGQAMLTARLAARNDALAAWTAIVNEVRVDSFSKNVDAALASDEVNVKIAGMVRSGRLRDRKAADLDLLGYDDVGWDAQNGIFTVVLEIPLRGPQGLGAVILPQVTKPNFHPAKPDDEPQFASVPPPDSRAMPNGAVTGIIVDCSKLDLEPAMSPKIFNGDTKQEIYGTANIDTDTAVQKGIVGYVTSLEAAKKAVERVGANPMVIPAVGMNGRAWAVISGSDADAILKADKDGGFLKKCNVMFVVKQD